MSTMTIEYVSLLVEGIYATTFMFIALASVLSRKQSRRHDAHTTLRVLLRREGRSPECAGLTEPAARRHAALRDEPDKLGEV